MRKAKLEKAIFLDRDGVLNHEPGDYTYRTSAFHPLPGVLQTLKVWQDKGFGLIVITNQGGIARGMYTHSDVDAVHQYFQGLCNLHGVHIDAFYYCPHHENYSGKCLCRKPGSLMLEKALHHFGLKPENCVMLGDKPRDMEAAAGAGVKGILLEINTGLNPQILEQTDVFVE